MSFFSPLVCAILIYLNHNSTILSLLHARNNEVINVNGDFFLGFLGVQGGVAFFLTAFIGPGTIAPDLSNGAMPLYFCRPFTRAEYVLGKLCSLFYLLSLITWIPALVLFGVEANLSGPGWVWHNKSLAVGIVLCSWIYILMISLMAMALSAWVRWRIAAGALILGTMFFLSGFGAAINAVLRSNVGYYIAPGALIARVCAQVFGLESPVDIPASGAWIALLVFCGLSLWLLGKKIRAVEVVS
jgi:ABC-2 type transport system permease protein